MRKNQIAYVVFLTEITFDLWFYRQLNAMSFYTLCMFSTIVKNRKFLS